MRIKAEDQKAADIIAILLDGKKVPGAAELDTKEGWVDVMVPKQVAPAPGKEEEVDIDTTLPAPSVEWERKRLHGNIEVIWRKSPTSVDGGGDQ